MFSPTTIASSTTIPRTRMNEYTVTILSDVPCSGMRAIAPKNVTGIPSVTQKASRGRKNSAKTTKTSSRPVSPFSTSRPTRLFSCRALSRHVIISIPSGSLGDSAAT